jgi:DNA repair protein RadC
VAELFAPFAGDDAGQLAERLIGHFGSLDRVLAAPLGQLRHAAGGHEGAVTAIFNAKRLVEAALCQEVARASVDGTDPALHRYLRCLIGAQVTERLHVVYCDAGRGYLADESIAIGTGNSVEPRIRPMVERALGLGAAGFLIAHNHPSGVCRPSDKDIEATRRIGDIAQALELELIDHLIVTRRRVFSMRAGGCL